jgi:hypothetical protein
VKARLQFVASVAVAVLALPAIALAQRDDVGVAITPVRFFMAAEDSATPPSPIEPSRLPVLRTRISVTLAGVSLGQALRTISSLSGLRFVYANDVIAIDHTVHLEAQDITVAAALTEILLDAAVNVILRPDGTAVLIAARRTGVLLQTDSIRGRVTTDSGGAIVGATVMVTMAPDRQLFRATTDSTGRYAIYVPDGTGDYLVYVAAPNTMSLVPFRKRITRVDSTRTLFVVDAVLKSALASQRLSAVTVKARKPAPSRNESRVGGTGGGQVMVGGVGAALLPEQKGDLTATVATLPGVATTTSGISVLGLPSDQNSVVLNGMAFPGASVPRDAQVDVQFATSPFDPSRGWFGGAETRVSLAHGALFSSLTTTATIDAPQLQAVNATNSRLGQSFTNVTLSSGAVGTTPSQQLSYNLSGQIGRRTTDLATLDDLYPAALQRVGVALDSASRFLGIARALGIPINAPGSSRGVVTTSGSFLAGLSTLPDDPQTFQPNRTVVDVTAYGSVQQTDGSQAGLLTTSGEGARSSQSVASIQGTLSHLSNTNVLSEFRSALSFTDLSLTPDLRVPSASVLVGSTFPELTGGLAALGAGGAQSGTASARTLTWESRSDTRFNTPASGAHRIHLSGDVRFDQTTSSSGQNDNGTFVFASLDDFSNNHPSAFTRILTAPTSRAGIWNAFAALADDWHPSQAFQLLYGVRVEGDQFADHAELNPAVERFFGVRTDYVPNLLHVSPRIGFTWTYNPKLQGDYAVRNEHGAFWAPAFGVLRGGIGEFRSLMPTTLFANASTKTGLADGFRQVSCVGAAVPTADWSAYASAAGGIPQNCAGGSDGSMSDLTQPVDAVAKDFTAPRSWRGNLSWTSHYDLLVWKVEGEYSLNLNQPGQVDLNFAGTPRFLLPDEGGRPVFIPASSIVPSSGALTAQASRRDTTFGSVTELRSDAQSIGRRLTLTLMPDLSRTGQSRFYTSLSYTLAASRALQNGYGVSTFGAPAAFSWSQGSLTPLHSFVLQGSARSKLVNISLFGVFSSGLPFTPMVGSDINGDGLANDRAFVFNPSSPAVDPGVAAGMRSLMATASSNVRSCLVRQLGQPASQNSCEGPWTARMNVRLNLNRSSLSGWAQRIDASIFLANPLAGLDQLMHGSKLQGWGDPAQPDPTLLQVTGFDPTKSRFMYAVNPRFGDTRPLENSLVAPFRVTLDIRMDFSVPRDQQTVDKSLQPGRAGHPGKRRTADETKRFYALSLGLSLDPFRAVLSLTDSLLLTTSQVRAIVEGQTRYNIRKDSVIARFSEWLAALPDDYDAAEALRRQNAMIDEFLNVGREETQATMKPILNAMQVKLLPSVVKAMYFATGRITLRDVQGR